MSRDLHNRRAMLPYGRHCVTEEDIGLVVEVLRSDWLTTGPMVERFEEALARQVGAARAVTLSSGTAALHAAMFAVGIAPGDEVIVPAMTFVATANCVVFQGGVPVFADVAPDTLLVDPEDVERRITSRTRAIVAVDYAGQPCDYERLRSLARRRGLALVADASHALGAAEGGAAAGSLADLTTFSLHPVKPITTGEGGMVTTDDPKLAERIRQFRNHGFACDHRQRDAAGACVAEMTELGYNYRLSDIQSALGLGQLNKLEGWLARRAEIATRYDRALAGTKGTKGTKGIEGIEGIRPLGIRPGVRHAWHLYVVRIDAGTLGRDRTAVYELLRRERIGAAVHYMPVHLQPYYRRQFGTGPGLCPQAEAAYVEILSLPIFPAMSDDDVDDVIRALRLIPSKMHPHYLRRSRRSSVRRASRT